MPLNLIKTYPQLLEIGQYDERRRMLSLRGVFKKDIEDNRDFRFRGYLIRPIKKEGQASMDVLFHHLTTTEDKDEGGRKTGSRSFESARSIRLHWIKHHVEMRKRENVDVFSYEDRLEGRGNVIRTYIYDIEGEYVIILEPQRSKIDYYLISAYHLNEPGGKKQIEKKQKKRLPDIH